MIIDAVETRVFAENANRTPEEVEQDSFWGFVGFCFFFLMLIGAFAAFGAQ